MKEKIIFFYPQKSSFISSDIEFLSGKYDVKTLDLPWGIPSKLIFNLCWQLFFLVKNGYKCKTIVISFGGYFSLLPVIFGSIFNIRTLLILHGTDCVSFPEYNYGSLRKPLLRFFVTNSQKYASKLLPVDTSLIRQIHSFDALIQEKKQGYEAFSKSIKTPVKIIPNGFDTHFWNYNSLELKTKNFICVVATESKATAIFKGVDLIIALAKKSPAKNFTIVGLSKELQKEFIVTDNVDFYTFIKKEKLRELYRKHQFYVQLSINEGFGCALSEAMLCGCIPIVSNAGALPNVAGSSSFIVKKRTALSIEKVVKGAIETSEEQKINLAKKARLHIVNNFDISIREHLLLQEIDE